MRVNPKKNARLTSQAGVSMFHLTNQFVKTSSVIDWYALFWMFTVQP